MLEATLQGWLPKGHLANFISDTVAALDLGAFCARDAGGALNQPFHPATMVMLLVRGCPTGLFNSRKIERRLHEDLAFRMLGADNFPRHRTIRDFRALHLKQLSNLFVQVVKLAREMGLVKLGTVAIDGTKIKMGSPDAYTASITPPGCPSPPAASSAVRRHRCRNWSARLPR